MTNDAKHDLLLLSCDCKRTRFPLDSLTPINSTMLFLKKKKKNLISQGLDLHLHPLSILYLTVLLYSHDFVLRFIAMVEN